MSRTWQQEFAFLALTGPGDRAKDILDLYSRVASVVDELSKECLRLRSAVSLLKDQAEAAELERDSLS